MRPPSTRCASSGSRPTVTGSWREAPTPRRASCSPKRSACGEGRPTPSSPTPSSPSPRPCASTSCGCGPSRTSPRRSWRTATAAVAIPELERLVAEEPGRERAWALLMRALYAGGRQHHALVAFQRARRALAESFGLDPGPELRALERQILDQDPELAVAGDRPALPAGPAHDPPDDRPARRARLADRGVGDRPARHRPGARRARTGGLRAHPARRRAGRPRDRRWRLGRVRARRR